MSDPQNSGEYPLTTTPLSKAAARASQLDPEFCDVRGLDRLFGIKRSLGYQLLAEGLIQSVSLRRRGQVRGKRLFSVDSVRAYLRKQMSNQKGIRSSLSRAPRNGGDV
jgi:hypothetical protein